MEGINERCKKAMYAARVIQGKIAEEAQMTQATISAALTGKDTNSIKIITVVSKLTGKSIEWLITGINSVNADYKKLADLEKEITQKDETIELQKKYITSLEKQINPD